MHKVSFLLLREHGLQEVTEIEGGDTESFFHLGHPTTWVWKYFFYQADGMLYQQLVSHFCNLSAEKTTHSLHHIRKGMTPRLPGNAAIFQIQTPLLAIINDFKCAILGRDLHQTLDKHAAKL